MPSAVISSGAGWPALHQVTATPPGAGRSRASTAVAAVGMRSPEMAASNRRISSSTGSLRAYALPRTRLRS